MSSNRLTQCVKCGESEMTLAEDLTRYSRCELEGGKWVIQFTDEQPSEMDHAVRFFCSNCGTAHAVPEELKGI